MFQDFSRLRFVFLSFVLAFPLLTAAQCGEKLKQGVVDIPVRKTIPFEIDLDKHVSSHLKKEGIPTTGKTLPKAVEIPIKLAHPIDLRKEPSIQKYGSKLAHVKVKMIATAVKNTANVDLPKINIGMRKKGSSKFTVIGYLSPIKAGKTGVKDNIIKSNKMSDLISNIFLSFAFDVQPEMILKLPKGSPIPKGKVKIELLLDMTFGVAPFK